VLRYDGTTGAFLGVFCTGGDNGLQDLVFGPDGNLYVLCDTPAQVRRYNGSTGEFIDVFATGSWGTDGISLTFGPDQDLYVTTGFIGNSVLRFDGTTGLPHARFVGPGSGGLAYATGLLFNPLIPEPSGFAGALLSLAAVLPRRRRHLTARGDASQNPTA
jgi:hypothetical protein